jgi:hypothetical protein
MSKSNFCWRQQSEEGCSRRGTNQKSSFAIAPLLLLLLLLLLLFFLLFLLLLLDASISLYWWPKTVGVFQLYEVNWAA